MIVQCDNCKSKFNLADEKVTEKGLKVRCSRCKTVFVARRSPEDSSPGASPPPAQSPPPAAKAAAAQPGADPFSDFSFSDDLDLDSKEDTTPAAPVSTERPPATPSHHDYTPSMPAPAPKAGRAPAAPAEAEDQFNFGDEDFAAPEPAAPPKRAPAQPAAAKPAPTKAAGSTEDIEFGDFNFDEESFAEPESPPAKAPPAKVRAAKAPPAPAPPAPASASEEGWGAVSFSDDGPSVAGDKAARPAGTEEDEGFGDFHFDADGSIGPVSSDEGPADELDSFVRSSTSRAPVRDDLEASLDTDAEAEPTPAHRSAVTAAPAGTPAKPVIRHSPRERSTTPWVFLAVVLVLLLGLAVAVAYLHVSKLFTLQDWTSGNFAKLKKIPQVQQLLIRAGWMEPPDTGTVELVPKSDKDAFVIQREGMNILVVKGTVRNTFRKPKSFLQVEVTLYDKDRIVLDQKKGYCDVTFTNEELRTLSLEDIKSFMNTRPGRKLNNMKVEQGETRDFMVVFYPAPPEAAQWDAKVVGYLDADAADALRQEESEEK